MPSARGSRNRNMRILAHDPVSEPVPKASLNREADPPVQGSELLENRIADKPRHLLGERVATPRPKEGGTASTIPQASVRGNA